MERRERLEEEFELEDEEQAFKDYAYIAFILSVNYSLIADELSKLGNFQKGLGIDIGTGLGDLAIEVARRYPALKVTGIDISQKAIETATNRAKQENINNVNFQLADVHNLPFEDNSVDLVLSHGTIHHLKDPSKAFQEIYRILKSNGIAYLTDLRRDAPRDIVKEVEKNLPLSQAKGFINSIHASYIPQELKDILIKLGIKNFDVSEQKFSRDTIFKNIDKLRKTPMRNVNYTKLSQIAIIKKKD